MLLLCYAMLCYAMICYMLDTSDGGNRGSYGSRQAMTSSPRGVLASPDEKWINSIEYSELKPIKVGVLNKQAVSQAKWKKRYVILCGMHLFFFPEQRGPPNGVVSIQNSYTQQLRGRYNKSEQDFSFLLTSPRGWNKKRSVWGPCTVTLACNSFNEGSDWMAIIRRISASPSY
eukprot:g76536.t1